MGVTLHQVPHHVQVGQAGFHHQEVGSLHDVAVGGARRQAATGGRQLVSPAVAKGRGGVGGVAEGAVEAGGELGRVGQHGHARSPPVLPQPTLEGARPAVHHVRRRHHVRPARRVLGRDGRQLLERLGLVRVARVARVAGGGGGGGGVPPQAAVSVQGEAAEAHVAGHGQSRSEGGLEASHRLQHRVGLLQQGAGRPGVLPVLRQHREQQNGAESEVHQACRLLQQDASAHPEHPRHRPDLRAGVRLTDDEHRPHQLARPDPVTPLGLPFPEHLVGVAGMKHPMRQRRRGRRRIGHGRRRRRRRRRRRHGFHLNEKRRKEKKREEKRRKEKKREEKKPVFLLMHECRKRANFII